MPEALSLPDVKVVRLTSTNNFAVKKLLLHDDLTSNYLVYDPFPIQPPKENWLRDIEFFSEQYRADRTSLLMSELSIEEKPALRKAVKQYAAFFKSRERTEALRKIGCGYKEQQTLHLNVMAALLPARSLSVNDRMEVLADGLHTRSTAEREKVLCAVNPKSVAVAYNDVLNMKRADRRSLVSGKEIVYIYHNTIDAVGDDSATEQKVFDACGEAIRELSNLLRIIISDMAGTDILITSDHGFLYTYSPLAESDKLSQECFSGTVYETGRRYALTEPSAVMEGLLPVKLEGLFAGTPIKGYAPQGATRIKIRGGGANYVHGGISLQELAVPVIHYKNLRASSKGPTCGGA